MAEPPVSDATIVRDATSAPRRATAAFMWRHPARWIALGFGSGLSPWAPGTVGTLWAWVAFLVLDRWLAPFGPWAWGGVVAASLLVGLWACTRTAEDLGVADPGAIVWDEVVAFWIVLWLVTPADWLAQFVALGLFRFFDAAKPGPVGWCDRRFKSARGWRQGAGILADDLVAAFCTLLVIALWRFVFP
ncbi:MAG TPA: phosphatidylglycerophosphatase A [Burkholderiaceae bacterium]|nr:phosphatidylglycerophosphatase A [Burkholderiaceae bacterium]